MQPLSHMDASGLSTCNPSLLPLQGRRTFPGLATALESTSLLQPHADLSTSQRKHALSMPATDPGVNSVRCDDGKDPEKRAWMKSKGPDFVYISGRKRAKGEMNGKSGNVNNICNQLYPDRLAIPGNEVLCIFDADQVFHGWFDRQRTGPYDLTASVRVKLATKQLELNMLQMCCFWLQIALYSKPIVPWFISCPPQSGGQNTLGASTKFSYVVWNVLHLLATIICDHSRVFEYICSWSTSEMQSHAKSWCKVRLLRLCVADGKEEFFSEDIASDGWRRWCCNGPQPTVLSQYEPSHRYLQSQQYSFLGVHADRLWCNWVHLMHWHQFPHQSKRFWNGEHHPIVPQSFAFGNQYQLFQHSIINCNHKAEVSVPDKWACSATRTFLAPALAKIHVLGPDQLGATMMYNHAGWLVTNIHPHRGLCTWHGAEKGEISLSLCARLYCCRRGTAWGPKLFSTEIQMDKGELSLLQVMSQHMLASDTLFLWHLVCKHLWLKAS